MPFTILVTIALTLCIQQSMYLPCSSSAISLQIPSAEHPPLDSRTTQEHMTSAKSTSYHRNHRRMLKSDVNLDLSAEGPLVSLHNTIGQQTHLLPIRATGVDVAHLKMRLAGQNIKIGIFDTGVDYMHPALGGGFGKGYKVAYGFDFVGDKYDGKNPPVEDKDPMDFSGHGTGVAGIIAAKTEHYVGIAPEATLGAYRIGGYRRDVYHDAIPKAIDMAIADGMDIINMSFGGVAAVVPKNLLDAFEKAAKNNIVVVAATANANYDFMWSTNFPADIPSVISVGTADARQVVVRRFKAESMKDPLHYDTICSNAQRLYMGGEVGIKLQLPQGDPKNKQCVLSRAIGQVILVPFFHCPIEELIAQAKANGAAGIMAPGLMYTDREIMCSTPVYAITDETFVSVYYHLQQRPDDDWIFTKDNGKMDLTPHIDSTTGSTWGPNLHMTLSPDMIAPGKDIFLTTAVKKGSYTLDTGTSFAAPYVSGMIALWFQHLGVDKVTKEARMPVARVKDLLRNACTPLTPSGDESPSPVAHQGAGLLNATTLLTTGTHVSPSAIEVSSEAYSKKRTVTPRGMVTSAQLTIINNLDVAQTYNFVHKPAPSVRGFDSSFKAIFPPQEVKEYANVVIKPATITVKGKGSITVSVTIAEPPKLPLAENWVYSGYIEVQPVAIKTQPAIHVPYLGLKGDPANVFKYLKQHFDAGLHLKQ